MVYDICTVQTFTTIYGHLRHKFSPIQSKSWSILIFIYPNIKAFFKSLHSSKPYLGPSHFTFVVTFYLPRAAVKTFTTIIFTGPILIIVSCDTQKSKCFFFFKSQKPFQVRREQDLREARRTTDAQLSTFSSSPP